ncbi:hypothetical protein BT69DRAFT_969783 [Atractiella rhizophila]|nr:hypothetical protein BT69DRAFT_969783 [Atractiella rhizophila]
MRKPKRAHLPPTSSNSLAAAISSAWETLIVKGADPETAKARLFLYVCAEDGTEQWDETPDSRTTR